MKFSPRINFNLNWLIAATVISVMLVHLNQARWKSRNVMDFDIAQYYSYLPATFYEKDLSLSFLNDTVNHKIESRYYGPNKTPTGNYVIKMTMGMALGYLPFFAVAHVYASCIGYETDGFSEPYHFAVLCSSLFYFLIGLLFLYKVLKFYFLEKETLLTLCCLCFGTNVYYYLTIGAGMSHIFSFVLFTIFLYYTELWYRHPGLKSAIFIGLTGGLMVLVRPVNLLIFVIFFLYNIRNFSDFSARLRLYFANRYSVLLILFCSIAVCVPQLLYWKQMSGSYFFNSYVGENFYFNKPQLINGLFSFRKGWLVYTPMMIFALLGFYALRKKLRAYSLAIPVFFILYIYVVFSWWCWWYGGSFGQRALVDIYPLLAIPLAAFLEQAGHFSMIKKRTVYSLVTLFMFLNLFQTVQAKYNIIHYDSMTKENYFRVFFTTTKQPDREQYLKHPDYKKALNGEQEN